MTFLTPLLATEFLYCPGLSYPYHTGLCTESVMSLKKALHNMNTKLIYNIRCRVKGQTLDLGTRVCSVLCITAHRDKKFILDTLKNLALSRCFDCWRDARVECLKINKLASMAEAECKHQSCSLIFW